MPTMSPCQICGGAASARFATRGDIELFRCDGCGFVFMLPPPDAAMLEALYADTYRGATQSYFTKVEAKLRRSRGRIRRLIRFLADREPRGKRFLDIGCNGGFMVEAARETGFAATGLEPDGAAIAWARRHYPDNRYVHGLLESTPLEPSSFDAAYCSEVIEHAPDANRFAAALAGCLKPGGIVYLTTPDISHWRRPRDLDRWDAFCPPAHCVFYGPRNLATLLAKHGLLVVHRAIAFKPGIKLIARRA